MGSVDGQCRGSNFPDWERPKEVVKSLSVWLGLPTAMHNPRDVMDWCSA